MQGRILDLPIEQELKDSYLTYAMSVIVAPLCRRARWFETFTTPNSSGDE
jgi:hypothetical protein